jgi:hypothetical protein
MPLTTRPAGLGSGIDKDRPDYTVLTGEWEVGRIFQTRGGPERLRWFWSMTFNGPLTRSDRVATLEELERAFRRAGTPGRRGRNWRRCREAHKARPPVWQGVRTGGLSLWVSAGHVSDGIDT